ncbi:peptidase S9 [Lysobacter bugurensis]|uniref:Peptidase S9 n=1 Tax=Cognatilysobacter bugurensis TaxID=543356 RepID=A0A918W865_9GAMM|nr:peptidase S9 [Lysobacter bugurensis]
MLALLLPAVVSAETGAPYKIEEFIRKDRFQTVRISPKGTYVAATVPVDDKTVLVVLKPGQQKPISHFNLRGKSHVMDFAWANDERLLFTVGVKDGLLEEPMPQGEIWGMDADGTNTKMLAGWHNADSTSGRTGGRAREPVFATLIDSLENDDDKAIISVFQPGATYTSAERMDVKSGARIPIAQAPVPRASFVTDRQGAVRFALGANNDNVSKLYYRKDEKAPWKLLEDEGVSGRMLFPLDFSADDRLVYMQAEHRTGPDSIVSFDVATEQMKEMARDDFVDPSGLVNAVGKSYPIGVQFDDPTPRFHYFEPDSPDAKLHKTLQTSFSGDTVVAGANTTERGEALLFTYSDRNPGDYFVFNLDTKQAQHLISRKDWIDPNTASETRVLEFQARDGRKIQAFLTVPKGSDGKNLPLVVNPHGGPIGVADGWSYAGERQMLAANGYAVLQVNFRGSGGYGREHQLAGYKQWGRAMQDDLTDATHWAIKSGVADPKRICVYGASYGGYASLMGVAKEPSLYRCAVGYVGVYDLNMMYSRGDVPQQLSGVNFLKDALGTEGLAETSPNKLASRIKVPVFLAAGGEDKRAPQEHSEAMERALKEAGVPVETLYYRTEGHGFYKVEHSLEFYTRLLSFLDRHIGPGAASSSKAN